ncbi:ABC transporter ATP-binding protein [Hungatella sp. L12]|uniref:ABC transporter ATP-binding protein n=1 Tax=Hungatella hominis TaxID=2763050 RepID=A0ABR7HAB1_9FIRM|nr:ABC transporter ATP-binding protein [Hungatella hominis]MBC5710070.1 ABC transporter ATP-binding protein [Hungatella hominis]
MINVENITMDFKMTNDKINSLKETIVTALSGKLQYHYFRALNNVSFCVSKGEVFGLIGANGAGKSTLLKVISGILYPTKGNVIISGHIAPLLELGAGFDPELSARENIYLNGALLGYSKELIDSKFEEIVDFSELGDFINVPIRNYSSGMVMRLGFSIATIVVPEVLIVDEILSVGDEHFKRKSGEKMQSLMNGETTVLFVSHDILQVRQLCNRVLWLEKGEIKLIGDSMEVCDAYLDSIGE